MSWSTEHADVRPRDHLFAAVVIGIATGLTEVLVVELRWTVFHQLVWTGTDMIWMVPLYYVGVFAGLGAGAALLAALLGPRWPLALTVGVATGVLGFSLLFLLFWFRLHVIALLLLSLGIGIQAGRAVNRRTLPFARRVRRLIPLAAAVIVLAAAGRPAIQFYREQQDVAGPRRARADAPNVLLIILDTVRAASLSLYGYERPTTPALERWAKRGVVFDRAIATTSWTLPSHASMFTGYYPPDLSTGWEHPLDGTRPTLAEMFHQDGYRTGGFVANLLYTTRETGISRGFARYRDFKISREQFKKSTALGQWWDAIHRRSPPRRFRSLDRKIGTEVTGPFLEWAGKPSQRPFFAFLNYFDAHQPYLAPQPWRDRFDSADVRTDRYDASIAYLDHQIDTILTELERQGKLRNTIVVVASDHGELLRSHNIVGHGNALYDRQLHVPLVIWYPPRVPAGMRIETPVSLRDLAATLTDLAGLPAASPPGTSLRGAWESRETWEPSPLFSVLQKGINADTTEPVSKGDMHSLYTDGVHYILNGDGTADLYDLATDPGELYNLAADSAWRAQRDSLDTALRALADSSPRSAGKRR